MRMAGLALLLMFMMAAGAQAIEVTGRIMVMGGGGPVAGAEVTAGESHVITDKAGWYRIDLSDGSYQLKISATGYESPEPIPLTLPGDNFLPEMSPSSNNMTWRASFLTRTSLAPPGTGLACNY